MNNKLNVKLGYQKSIKGFTLIEMAIVLVVIGIIISAAQSFYRGGLKTAEYTKIQSQLESINQALITYAMQNNRLPCADTNDDGYEEASLSNCQTGAVPYKTLGMNQMANTQTQISKRNIVYGVYRNSNVIASLDADLTLSKDRTGDLPGSQYYENNFDFIKALSNGNNNAFNNTRVYTAGDETTVDCTIANDNYAYILASAGVDDADNDGNEFDGVNKDLKLDGTGTLCFSSAIKRKNNQYDDIVMVMHFQSLIGRLNTIN